MNLFKRIVLFIGLCIALDVGMTVVGRGMASVVTESTTRNGILAPKAGIQAADQFDVDYQPMIFALSFIISALVAFGPRVVTLGISVPLALLGSMMLKDSKMIEEARMRVMQLGNLSNAAPSATPRELDAGDKVVLLAPIDMNISYGEVTMPRGTVATVVADAAGFVEVQSADGSTFFVPLTEVQRQ
jgi:hypothetical protein